MRILGYISVFLAGGVSIEFVRLLIDWCKEKREQRIEKTADEKDRPRFRVDVVVTEPTNPMRPTVIVRVLSLGSLPITIEDGEVLIKSPKD